MILTIGFIMAITNYMTIDVEDYYQVSAFEKISPPSTWAGCESRVERNTDLILAILDESSIKATFFVLGCVAEHCPGLVKAIAAQGHEIASHGYGHQRLCNMTRDAFREDVRRSKSLLEDATGQQVYGYRAPSYSISRDTLWAFDELCAAGYLYDSSIFPIRHDYYGIPDWQRFAGTAVKVTDNDWQSGEALNGEDSIMELPITTLQIAGMNFPIAGGGYFRLLPYELTKLGLQSINRKEEQSFVFYLHPWEFDPEQPRMAGAGWKSNFRHYLNLDKTAGRFGRLLNDFSFGTILDGLQLKPS